jgi:hypothetical protein
MVGQVALGALTELKGLLADGNHGNCHSELAIKS